MRGATTTLASKGKEASKSKPKIKMTVREPSKPDKTPKISTQTSSLKAPAKSNLKASSKLDPNAKKPSKRPKIPTKSLASKRKASASDESESEDEDEAPRRGLPSKQRTPSTEPKRDNIFIQFGESGFADDLDSNFIDHLQLGQESPLSPVRSVNDIVRISQRSQREPSSGRGLPETSFGGTKGMNTDKNLVRDEFPGQPSSKSWNYKKPQHLKRTVETQHLAVNDYLGYFPTISKGEAEDKRLSLIGKMNLAVRIEQIYDFGTSRIAAGQVNPTCAIFTEENFTMAFAGHPRACTQSLLNFLYSVAKLKDGEKNVDVYWYDCFLRESITFSAFSLFLLARLIFQRILEKDIVQRQILKVDPVCTELSTDLVWELITRMEKAFDHHVNLGEILSTKLEEVEREGFQKLDYYEFMELLITSVPESVSEAQTFKALKKTYTEVLTNQASQLAVEQSNRTDDPSSAGKYRGRTGLRAPASRSTSRESLPHFQTKVSQMDASSRVERPSGSRSNLPSYSRSRTPDRPTSGHNGDKQRPDEDVTQILLQADPIRSNQTRSQTGQQGNHRDTNTSRSIHSMANPDGADDLEIFLDAEPNSPLNRRIRSALVSLISVFLDILIQDTLGQASNHSLHGKMNMIVVRKSMNLLTCIFRNSKQAVLELLRVSQAFESDKQKINAIFTDYQEMVQQADNPKVITDERVSAFAKRILKLEQFVAHVVNLVKFTSTPLDELIKQDT